MRQWLKLVSESLDRMPTESVVEYFANENCASFAFALWIAHGKPAGATFEILSDPNDEVWEGFDEVFTHVVYSTPDNILIDVRGVQTRDEIREHYYGYWSASYSPAELWTHAVGMSDDKPLYGDEATVREALEVIRQYPSLYGLTGPLEESRFVSVLTPAEEFVATASNLIRDRFAGAVELNVYDGDHIDGRHVDLNHIATKRQQQGLGSHAMTVLCNLADELGVVLELGVANADDNMGPPGEAKLIEWYERFGFEVVASGFAEERVPMRREPDGYETMMESARPTLRDLRRKPKSFPPQLSGRDLAQYIVATDDIDYSQQTRETVDWDHVEAIYEKFGNATASLKKVPITGLEMNSGRIDSDALEYYRELKTQYPPIVLIGKFIYEGNHRVALAKERGETHVWAYVVKGLSKQDVTEWGRIVKGVNTTADVGEDQISIEAKKFGNKVSKDGRPPLIYEGEDRRGQLESRWNDPTFLSRYEPLMNNYHCETVAEVVRRLEPGTVIWGFSDDNNPGTAHFDGDGDDGHVFAVVDGRYIVDPWMFESEGRSVWDLRNPSDKSEIERLYGDRSTWGRHDNVNRYTRDSDFSH